jgi:hypothetical protein
MTDSTSTSDESDLVPGELLKVTIDFLKHVTTLSSGSILLLATFLEKLFQHPHLTFLIAISFASFALSIIGAFTSIIMLLGAEKASGYGEGIAGTIEFWLVMFACAAAS